MNLEIIIEKMTLEQKAVLLSGKNQFESQEIESFDIPSMKYADGPHGVRKQLGAADHLGLNESAKATCFPTAASLANSWNESLIEEVGKALGEEAFALDVDVLLGPGLNIKKNVLSGRNFEYYSEDPLLSGKLAAASIRGIQSNGTIATPKHFAVNSQEYKRMASNSIVDERTMHEIYLSAFEIAIKEGKSNGIMSSYNLVNGVYANESYDLLQNILREQWGFDGFVVSDWGGSNDHVEGVKNGSHAEMPGSGLNPAFELIDAVNSGRLDMAVLNQRVYEFLNVVLKSNAGKSREGVNFDIDKHHQLAKRAAQESIVLLKNEENTLPLIKQEKIAVFGDFARIPRYQGSGSSVINPTRLETPLEELKASTLNIIGFSKGYKRQMSLQKEDVNEALSVAKQADVLLVYLGLDEVTESEGVDRSSMLLPENQLEFVELLKETGKKIIVVLAAGSVIDMSWDEGVSAIIHAYLPGQAGASAITSVISGDFNPSGKLAETYPISYADVPFGEQYPYKGKYAYYHEGIYVGYRYYDTASINVKYPFGFGLSYTDFEVSNVKIENSGVTFDIMNSGSRDGATTLQIYVGKEDSSIPRPKKSLNAFRKIYLEKGVSQTVMIPLSEHGIRYYNPRSKSWEVESGVYTVYLASDVNTIIDEGQISISGTESDYSAFKNLPQAYFDAKLDVLTESDFELIHGKVIPREVTTQKSIDANSTIMDLDVASNPLARFISRYFSKRILKAERKGVPDLNLLFMYNMPFRAMGKMTNGLIDQAMVDDLVTICNGHFFRGIARFIKHFRLNRKRNKRGLGEGTL